MIKKRSLFWYKAGGKKNAAIILDLIENRDYFFVLISENINGADSVEKIMEAPAYTAAWFSSCLFLSNLVVYKN